MMPATLNPSNLNTGLPPTTLVPVKVAKTYPVALVVGDTTWTSEFSESQMKNFSDKAGPEDLDFRTEDGVTYLYLQIEEKDADYRIVRKSVACCAYNATEQLLKNIYGVNLHTSDRKWYEEHPLTVSSGVPAGVTFGVLQALVSVYGFGISEIMYIRGRGKQADTNDWKKVLGVNPLSMNNPLAIDDDYLANFAGLDPETFNPIAEEVRNCGFRYVDEIQGPAVIFGQVAANGNGGHATYLAPRERSSAFQYALRYKRLEQINYRAPVEPLIHDYDGQAEPERELSLWGTKYKGRTLGAWTSAASTPSIGNPSHRSNGGYSGVPDKKNPPKPSYTPPKPKEALERLDDTEGISLEEAETKVEGFLLLKRAGIQQAFDEDFELNVELANMVYNFVKTTAPLCEKIPVSWAHMPCRTNELNNRGRSAKTVRREIRKFRNVVGKFREGLCNYVLALDRLKDDDERWLLCTLVNEVYC